MNGLSELHFQLLHSAFYCPGLQGDTSMCAQDVVFTFPDLISATYRARKQLPGCHPRFSLENKPLSAESLVSDLIVQTAYTFFSYVTTILYPGKYPQELL